MENKATSASTYLRSPSDCRTCRVSSWKPANKRVCITPVVTWVLMVKWCHETKWKRHQQWLHSLWAAKLNYVVWTDFSRFLRSSIRTSWNSLKPRSCQKKPAKHCCSSQRPVTMFATVAKASSWLSRTALCFFSAEAVRVLAAAEAKRIRSFTT